MPATLEVEATLTDRYQTTVPETGDPVLGHFLGFLARDIASHSEHLQAVDADLVQRLRSLVGGAEVDLDAALSTDDE